MKSEISNYQVTHLSCYESCYDLYVITHVLDKKKEELIEYDERTRMLRIVNAFTEEQVDRYEIFRRSCFPRNQIKRLMQQVSGTIVNQQVCIAMAGVAKVFVGELVEEALKVAVCLLIIILYKKIKINLGAKER